MNNLISSLLIALACTGIGCAHGTIEGTTVPDTEENRAVLEVLKTYRTAMQERDVDKIIALVSSICVIIFGSISFPLLLAAFTITSSIVNAACSPPITPVFELGQENRKSGL